MNTVTKEQLELLIDKSDIREYVAFNKIMLHVYKLPSGFVVVGKAACVDPENFRFDIGRKICRENAIDQLWELEGYLLQNSISDRLS